MLTLMMTSAQVVETSVNVTSNRPSQDHTYPDHRNLPTYDMTPGFKPELTYNKTNKIAIRDLHPLSLKLKKP